MADIGSEKVLEKELASDMKKIVEIKEDGRQLIYYDFTAAKESELSKEQDRK